MNFLYEWGEYSANPDIREWVQSNFWRLNQMMDIDDDLDLEEKEDILIKYFSKYPDQIKMLNIEFPQYDIDSYVPKIQNIGSYIKYR
jgi:hypothetical protein